MLQLTSIQQFLAELDCDGWFLYDYRRSNPIAHRLLGLPITGHFTRRFALWIPRQGDPIIIISSIETHLFDTLPWNRRHYRTHHEWYEHLRWLLNGQRRIATEYSPYGEIPALSFLDAGTAEFLYSLGVELVSSADLIQHIEAVWTNEQIADNLITAQKLRRIMMSAIEYARTLAQSSGNTEYTLQQYICQAFEREKLVTDHPPIVACGINTANPHYTPEPLTCAVIEPDSLLLLDMWAKSTASDATYADITWTIWLGTSPPQEIQDIARIAITARDAAIALVQQRFSHHQPLAGYEVDDAARQIISAAGYGEYFIHRTGHNIGTEVHGYGANLDNYETHDTRLIICGTSFSIEPGIYLPNRFGFRTECNIVIDHAGNVLIPSEPLQKDLITIEV